MGERLPCPGAGECGQRILRFRGFATFIASRLPCVTVYPTRGRGRVAETDDGFEAWLRDRLPERGLRPKSAAVVEVLVSQPRRASFGSTAELAQLAGVNVATVTRTAQALGFAGWPALQQELRARYMSSLSAPQVAEEHRGVDSPGSASLRRDLDSLALLNRRIDEEVIREVARAIAAARRTLVFVVCCFAVVGFVFVFFVCLVGFVV